MLRRLHDLGKSDVLAHTGDEIVDTSNWIGGRTVLIAPEWTERIEWTEQRLYVDATRDSAFA
jgi:hypothetical protein